MSLWRLAWRGVLYYWPLHLAVAAAIAVAALVTSGSLLVAHSVEASLHEVALRRIGPTDVAIQSSRWIRQEAARLLAQDPQVEAAAELVIAPCSVAVLDPTGRTKAVASHVNLIGVSAALYDFLRDASASGDDELFRELLEDAPAERALINRFLAQTLGDVPRGSLLEVRTASYSDVPREHVLGRKDQVLQPGGSLQLRGVLQSSSAVAEFSLRVGPQPPLNLYVPLAVAQRLLGAPGRVNAVLVKWKTEGDPAELLRRWRQNLRPEDLGLRLRVDDLGYVALESNRVVLHPAVVDAARRAAKDAIVSLTAVQVATTIEDVASGRQIPYSLVAAFDVSLPAPLGGLTLVDGTPAPPLASDEIYLNTWAAEDLDVRPGASIRVSYFTTTSAGRLVETERVYRLKGIVRMEGLAADPDLVPPYPGVTDAAEITEWDAPFPVDFSRIRPKDEDYWRRYRTVPKAFLAPDAARRDWLSRWGVWTSVRFFKPDADPRELMERLRQAVIRELSLADVGVSAVPVRQMALRAATGSTDFRGLFLGFSSFLLIAAFILASTGLRLGLLYRRQQTGLLLAVGFRPVVAQSLPLLELLPWVLVSAAIGSVAGRWFAQAMIAGLRGPWRGAMTLYELEFHSTPAAYLVGVLASVLALPVVYAVNVRAMRGVAVRRFLSAPGLADRRREPGRWLRRAPALCAAGAVVATLLSLWLEQVVAGFFAAGTLALLAGLTYVQLTLLRPRAELPGAGWRGLWWLAAAGVRAVPARTSAIAILIALATFLIVGVGANRHEPEPLSRERTSSHGGFAIVGLTSVPVFADLNVADDRAKAGVPNPDDPRWDRLTIYALRYRPGDDASCLNTFRPVQPAIVGVPKSFRQRGGFRTAATLSGEDCWQALDVASSDDAVPAVLDDQTATWILHLGIGDQFSVSDDHGRPLQLQVVGTLRRSLFQSELLIREEDFLDHFPFHEGYRFFLVECEPSEAGELLGFLEGELAAYGFDGMLTTERLARYYAVENTYLDTFALLGGLGLVLGTAGLGAVLWRAVLERAGQLALLRAIGFSRAQLAAAIMMESVWILGAGMAVGTAAALLAVIPQLLTHAEQFPASYVAALLAGVAATGMISSLLAVRVVLKLPVVQTLRGE